ncbi:2903_t:CDS:2 [Diversispora eburnea]|uniref:2903_t:CDS:1 n=1 Tax=Diversispora eburnea TaxID=1213867 RepID=A0A9N9EYF8_9GLOM|nr:2903_t:CDS:2 [Diversispora eburnea]
MANKKKDKLFQDIGEIVQAENEEDNRPMEIESYCVNCEKNGITKMLLTRIPHWREIVIMSFECEHCGLSNNEVQFAGSFAEKGCAYTCEIDTKEDLNRQLVKSETATVIIPELELEIPSTTKKGRLTTIEGLVTSIIEDLSTNQPVRKHTEEKTYNKIENIIQKLSNYLENKEKFSVTVDDPAGNREVIIMSTVCDNCGYKSNEVKTNGGIHPTGKKITLLMETIDDLSRDILKSETCGLSIPELDLELQSGTLGGRFTTIEGLLRQVYDELIERIPFVNKGGDSVQDKRRETFKNFLEKLDKVISGEVLPAHIILDDPLSNSYLQNPYAPGPDPNMEIEIYKRSWEQNEILGLNDIVLENYGSTP